MTAPTWMLDPVRQNNAAPHRPRRRVMTSQLDCRAMSKPVITADPDSYFICTRNAGHDGAHSACDRQGHVLARWTSDHSKIRAWTAGGTVTR